MCGLPLAAAFFPLINSRNMKRFGWQASATARGTGRGALSAQAAINSPESGAVISPREPWPLLMNRPSSQGQGVAGICRASRASTA
ncbi:hypothetical protein D3C76_1787750 [compost metagenome]